VCVLADERRGGRGGNGEQRGEARGAGVFICRRWSRCRLHLDGGDWARVAVYLVRRCEPSLALGSARSGVRRVLRGSAGFRSGACVLLCGTACWAG
jgi:hypothetical protein